LVVLPVRRALWGIDEGAAMTRSARQAGDPALARIERVVSRIREVYGRKAIAVDLERDASPDVTDSSVFGPPFLPDGEEIPRDWRGEQLTLLARST